MRRRQNCPVTRCQDAEKCKEIWDQSKAGQIGDAFISNHSLEHWVQDFDQEIFDAKNEMSDKWFALAGKPRANSTKTAVSISASFLHYFGPHR